MTVDETHTRNKSMVVYSRVANLLMNFQFEEASRLVRIVAKKSHMDVVTSVFYATIHWGEMVDRSPLIERLRVNK